MTENKNEVNKENTFQSRFKSPTYDLERINEIKGLILEATGVFCKIGLDGDEWDAIITSVGTVLAAFGIVNNPTSKNNF